MKIFVFVFMLVTAFSVCKADKADIVTTSGDCATAGKQWIRTERWIVTDFGRYLDCSMGVGCNGVAWNTCGGTVHVQPDTGLGGNHLYDTYTNMVYDDSVRASHLDFTNHLTSVINGLTSVDVTSDVAVHYLVINAVTGDYVYNNQTLMTANITAHLDPSTWTTGPYIVVAYNAGGTVEGYQTLIR